MLAGMCACASACVWYASVRVCMLVCMRVRVVPVGAERAEVVAVVEHTTTVPCSGRAWRTLPAHARQALLAFTSLRGPRRNAGEGGDALVY